MAIASLSVLGPVRVAQTSTSRDMTALTEPSRSAADMARVRDRIKQVIAQRAGTCITADCYAPTRAVGRHPGAPRVVSDARLPSAPSEARVVVVPQAAPSSGPDAAPSYVEQIAPPAPVPAPSAMDLERWQMPEIEPPRILIEPPSSSSSAPGGVPAAVWIAGGVAFAGVAVAVALTAGRRR